MNKSSALPFQDVSLNVSYDAPPEIWDKLGLICMQMPGWIESADVCRWFSAIEKDDVKHLWLSVEPGGLQLAGNMADDEWHVWIEQFKQLATEALGYPIGDASDGYEFRYF